MEPYSSDTEMRKFGADITAKDVLDCAKAGDARYGMVKPFKNPDLLFY